MREKEIEKLRKKTGGDYHSTGMRSLTSELDYRDGKTEERYDCYGTAEILNEYKERISVGQPMEGISELGGNHRQLLQESDFFAINNVVLKRLSAEEELEKFAIDYQNIPRRLGAKVQELIKQNANTGALLEVIRKFKKDEKTLEWLADNWQEYVEVQEVIKTESEERFPRPPKDNYSLVEVFHPSSFKEASERRNLHFKARLLEIYELSTIQEIETYLDSIQTSYQEDKELLTQWSRQRREEDRAHYLGWLRRSGLDFESIRRKLWATFDRVPGEKVIAVDTAKPLKANWMVGYNSKKPHASEDERAEASIVVTKSKKIGSPIWDLERSKAMCSLNQTRDQWNKVYDHLFERMGYAITGLAAQAKTSYERSRVDQLISRYERVVREEFIAEALILLYGDR